MRPADRHAQDAEETARRLFAGECRFVIGAARAEDLPPPRLPEVAFAGRSNVGKSSLLNALTGRKTLARISHTPGRTRQLNFFDLGGRLMLVDLPGYGYARAPKSQVRDWTGLIHAYLKGRPNLRRVCLLVDARHGPMPNDLSVMNELDADAVPYQVILTKADKVRPDRLAHLTGELSVSLAAHTACHPETVVTSAREGTGIAELRLGLAALAKQE